MKKLKLDKYTINKKDIIVFITNIIFWIIIQFTYIWMCDFLTGDISDVLFEIYFCILSLTLVLVLGIYNYAKLRSLIRCFFNLLLSFSISLNVAIIACLYYANDAFDSQFLDFYTGFYVFIFTFAVFQLLVYVIAKLIHVIALAIRKRHPIVNIIEE